MGPTRPFNGTYGGGMSDLAALARTPRPTTVAGVVARMQAVEAGLPPEHGVAVFTRLYRWTTEQVGAAIAGRSFAAPTDMTALDIAFADLYFDAVDAWALGQPAPAAWRPLFAWSQRGSVPALAFALAGMNAHINRDLPVALARSGYGRLRRDSPQHQDFAAINDVLAATSDQIRGRILPPELNAVDQALGEADDALVMQAIITARAGAWRVGEQLYALAGLPPLFDAALAVLDASVGATAHAILDPAGVIGAEAWRGATGPGRRGGR